MLDVWAPQMYHTMQGLSKLPSVASTLYRGRTEDFNVMREIYAQGRVVKFGAWTSTTPHLHIAARMTAVRGVVLRILASNAKTIKAVSMFEVEDEYLLPPEEYYCCGGVAEQEYMDDDTKQLTTCRIIEMVQVRKDSAVFRS